MNKGVNNSTLKIALCGVISALSVVMMMITSLIPVGTYALPCFAGLLTIAIVIEYGCKWSLGVYVVVSILSLFLAGDKEAVLYFIAIFGYYPILKKVIESKIGKKAVQVILKLAVFNTAAVGSFYIAELLLPVSAEEYTIFGIYIPIVFLIVGNLFFIIYDYAVTVYVGFYVRRLRPKLFGKIK